MCFPDRDIEPQRSRPMTDAAVPDDCRASWSDGECVWTRCPLTKALRNLPADPTAHCPLWTPDTWGNGRDGEEFPDD